MQLHPGGGGGGYFTMKSVGVLGPGKNLSGRTQPANVSYEQLLKWGSMGEMSRQGQRVNKAQPCTVAYVGPACCRLE